MIYFVDEDSFLLSNYLKRNINQFMTVKNKKKEFNFLDMGTGNLYQSENFVELLFNKEVLDKNIKKINLFLSDIDKRVFFSKEGKKNIQNLKEKVRKLNSTLNNTQIKLFFLNVDLLNSYKRKFDLILFNPPYLAYDEREGFNFDTTGGIKGYETSLKFLNQLINSLNINGNVLLIVSNFIKDKLNYNLSKLPLDYKIVDKKDLFPFEQIFLYLIKWKVINKNQENLLKKECLRLYYFNKGKKSIIFRNNLFNKYLLKLSDEKSTNKEIKNLKYLKNKRFIFKRNFIPNFFVKDGLLFIEEIKGISYKDLIKSIEKLKIHEKKDKKKSNINKIRKIIVSVLKESLFYSFLLDIALINKEEMNHPQKHLIFSFKDRKTYFIDFERAHLVNKFKKTKNLAQFASFSFKEIEKINEISLNKERFIELLKDYKKSYCFKTAYLNYKKIKEFIFKSNF